MAIGLERFLGCSSNVLVGLDRVGLDLFGFCCTVGATLSDEPVLAGWRRSVSGTGGEDGGGDETAGGVGPGLF